MTASIRDRQQARFEVVPARAALGAEVRGLDLKRLDDATFTLLHQAWLDNVLLVFRGQSLAAEDVVNLVRRFGTPVTSSNLHKRDLKERASRGGTGDRQTLSRDPLAGCDRAADQGRVSDTDPLRAAGGQIPEGPSSTPRRAPRFLWGCDPRWRSAADTAWLLIAMKCRRPLRPR